MSSNQDVPDWEPDGKRQCDDAVLQNIEDWLAKQEPHLVDDLSRTVFDECTGRFTLVREKVSWKGLVQSVAFSRCKDYMRAHARALAIREYVPDLSVIADQNCLQHYAGGTHGEELRDVQREAIELGLSRCSEEAQQIWKAYRSAKLELLELGIVQPIAKSEANDQVALRFKKTKGAVAQTVYRVNEKIRDAWGSWGSPGV